MSTCLSTKLAALGVALLVNGAIIGGVAYLFSSITQGTAQLPPPSRAASLVALMPTI